MRAKGSDVPGANGLPLWDRRIHLGEPPLVLDRSRQATCWSGRETGAGAAFSVDGAPSGAWVPRAPSSRHPDALHLARRPDRLPGEVTRAVEPRGGRVLAEVRTGLGLSDLAADARLNVYALDEDGNAHGVKLSTTFSVR